MCVICKRNATHIPPSSSACSRRASCGVQNFTSGTEIYVRSCVRFGRPEMRNRNAVAFGTWSQQQQQQHTDGIYVENGCRRLPTRIRFCNHNRSLSLSPSLCLSMSITVYAIARRLSFGPSTKPTFEPSTVMCRSR